MRYTDTRSNWGSFVCVINPYGGVYPESNLKDFESLKKILGFVKEGGIFTNVADIPSYWAYDPLMKRRIDATPSVYAGFQMGNNLVIGSQKPYDLTPLMKELALRSLNVDPERPLNINSGSGTSVAASYKRTVVVESNVETAVPVTRLPYPDGSTQDTSPIFFVRYGEGDFLLSLLWINDTGHSQLIKDSMRYDFEPRHSENQDQI